MREPLAILQARFVDAVTGVPIAAGLEPRANTDFIAAHDEAEARFRLGIYRAMHESRLTDVLAQDFPRVRAIVGEEAFEGLARSYLQAHPSRSHDLSRLSSAFPTFLARQPLARRDLFDIARLDQIRNEIFDAPDDAPLRLEHLQSAFGAGRDLQLRLVAAAALLTTAFDIDDAWVAADHRRTAPLSKVGSRTFLVWRLGHVVRHRAVEEAEDAMLHALERGVSLTELCQLIAAADPDDGPRRVFDVLSQWLADELVTPAA